MVVNVGTQQFSNAAWTNMSYTDQAAVLAEEAAKRSALRCKFCHEVIVPGYTHEHMGGRCERK